MLMWQRGVGAAHVAVMIFEGKIKRDHEVASAISNVQRFGTHEAFKVHPLQTPPDCLFALTLVHAAVARALELQQRAPK